MALQLEVRPNLRPYEGVVLVHPDASEDDQKTLFKKNKAIIEDQFGGSLKTVDTWGKRTLSNPIEKIRKAVYFHVTFAANPAAIAELERTMRINDKVLRFMHTRLDDDMDLATHMENFKKSLAESAAREREREAKFQARKAAMRGGAGGGRRDDRRDDEGGGGPGGGGPGGPGGPPSRPGAAGPGGARGPRPAGPAGIPAGFGSDEGMDDES
jgi:small subunit ribosomal protein S6